MGTTRAKTQEQLLEELESMRTRLGELGSCEAEYEKVRGRYENLLNSAPDALIFVDRSGTIVRVNNQFERLFDYDAGEVVGKQLDLVIPARYRGGHQGRVAEYFANPRIRSMGSNLPISGLKKDGTEFPADVSLSPARGEGDPMVTAAVRDITARKESEERIELGYHTQRCLSEILKISLDPAPLDTQFQRVLDLILAVPGLGFRNKGAIYLAHEETRTLNLKAHRRFSEKHLVACGAIPFGKCLCGTAALTRKVQFAEHAARDDIYQHVDVTAHGHYCVPIVSDTHTLGLINVYVREGKKRHDDEERFLVAVANTLAGIVVRDRAEQGLQESEERYRSLVENLNVGVYRNTPGSEGRFLHANRTIARMFGYDSVDDFMKTSVASLYQRPEERQRVVGEIARNGFVKDKELRLSKKDGTPIWASFSARAQYDESGVVKWFDGVVEDITDRKRAERERQALQGRLHQAEKLAALGRFTLDVAHQIRNPLTVVGGFARRLGRELDTGSREHEYAEIISAEVARLEEILRNVLVLTESEEPNRTLEDPNELVAGVIEGYAAACHAREIVVETTYGDLPGIPLDGVAVKRAIGNVVENAVEAMDREGLLIVVTGEEIIRGARYVGIEIVDDGPGIADEDIGKIWEPFYTTKVEAQGTGLGLPISRKIIEDHGGVITVHSEVDRGTMFTLAFPIAD